MSRKPQKVQGCTTAEYVEKRGVAAIQDLLIYNVKGLSWWMDQANKNGVSLDPKLDLKVLNAIFQLLQMQISTAKLLLHY